MSDYADAIDDLLSAHVAGSLALPLDVLARSYLELSPDARTFTHGLEAASGHLLEDIQPVTVSARETMLERVFAVPQDGASPAVAPQPDGPVPVALRRFIGCDLDQIPWTEMMPGILSHEIGSYDGIAARIVRLAPGLVIPAHDHEGIESALILDGGLTDEHRQYLRGDLSMAGAGIVHRQQVDYDGECLCFAVTVGTLKFIEPL
ncbi:cupin domain-containing protein [Rhodobium gokarnense]|uniref:Transcriptional regulator n=1 Tax=Rhodobium gokarnense TaxID=364296 RepID=A0ABT3HAI9_9HYPH|nr:cupin domain-containing protein [Rhodobium gokarnense]MCW2307306.1 putative transcriptional regulator [Rhodobium gokarnense]